MSSIPFTVPEVRAALNRLHKLILDIEHLTPYRNAPPAGNAAPPAGNVNVLDDPEEISDHKEKIVVATVSSFSFEQRDFTNKHPLARARESYANPRPQTFPFASGAGYS
jgi:hypothetical protein